MLKFVNLTKYYNTKAGKNFVIKDTTLDLPLDRNIGLLGVNGAGKSTLLRMIGGIEYPSSGEIINPFKCSWPLGLAGGYQGSMSGRDNALFVLRIYGVDESEIFDVIQWIKDFSGLEDYFEMPMKTYSSGMRGKLAFAVSMVFDFDCYLIDEITAVGDQKFKEKSRKALEQRSSNSKVIMVSHDVSTIRAFCQSGVYINNGEINYFEDIEDAIKEYTR